MKRNKIVAGNWKMNLAFNEAQELVDDLLDRLEEQEDLKCEVILCPPFPYLELLMDFEFDEQLYNVGAQNCATYEKGAYTGEVSVSFIECILAELAEAGGISRQEATVRAIREAAARRGHDRRVCEASARVRARYADVLDRLGR